MWYVIICWPASCRQWGFLSDLDFVHKSLTAQPRLDIIMGNKNNTGITITWHHEHKTVFVAGAGAAPGSHPAAGNEYRAELAQAKRREAEASTRVAALEAKLKSSSSGFGEMQATIQELTHRVQVCCKFASLASELLTCEGVVVLSVCSADASGQLTEMEAQQKM